jgi:hypothetical protein
MEGVDFRELLGCLDCPKYACGLFRCDTKKLIRFPSCPKVWMWDPLNSRMRKLIWFPSFPKVSCYLKTEWNLSCVIIFFLWMDPKKSKEQNNSIGIVCLFWYMSCQFLTRTSNCYVWSMCWINISFRESNCQCFDVTCAFSVVHLTSFKGKMFLCMCLFS